MTEARPTEERDEALEIAKRYVPPALEEWVRGTPMKQVRDALAAEIRAYGERQTNAARQNWRSRMGLTASSDELLARAERAEADLAAARRFAEEAAAKYNTLLAEGRVLRCAFCNAEYPLDTPPTQHEALLAHVKVCTAHPMRAVEADLAALKDMTMDPGDTASNKDERPIGLSTGDIIRAALWKIAHRKTWKHVEVTPPRPAMPGDNAP